MALARLTGTRTIRGSGLGFGFWLCLPVPPSSSCWWGRWEGSSMGTVARRSIKSHLVPIRFQNTAGRRSAPVKDASRFPCRDDLRALRTIVLSSLRPFFPSSQNWPGFLSRAICSASPAPGCLRYSACNIRPPYRPRLSPCLPPAKSKGGFFGTSRRTGHFFHSRNSLAALGKLRAIRESREQTS